MIEKAWRAAASRRRSARLEFETPTPFDIHITRVSFEGLKMRWEVTGRNQDGPLEGSRIEVSDGTHSKWLLTPGFLSPLLYPTGQVRKDPIVVSASGIDGVPVLFAMSRLSPEIVAALGERLRLEKYTVSDQPGQLADTTCVVLKQGDPQARKREWIEKGVKYYAGNDPAYLELWLDPLKDYCIVRSANYRNGHLKDQIDIQYDEDAEHNWVPKSWTIRIGTQVQRSRVVKWETNPTFKPTEFELEFPSGTFVSDQTSPTANPRWGTEEYIVRPDGSKRLVPFEEGLHHSYDELLNSGPGAPRGWTPTLVIIGLCVAALAAIIVAICLRYQRKRPRSHESPNPDDSTTRSILPNRGIEK